VKSEEYAAIRKCLRRFNGIRKSPISSRLVSLLLLYFRLTCPGPRCPRPKAVKIKFYNSRALRTSPTITSTQPPNHRGGWFG